MSVNQPYYARGKILLTAEFIILHGAKALAVPLKVGQLLEPVEKRKTGVLHWRAAYNSTTWFETEIALDGFQIKSSSSSEKSENLLYMIKKLLEITPEFLEKLLQYDVVTTLEFDPHFGFGSSSTLTSLLAQWAGVDPMQFHFRISRGSGYDVACANANSPIVYELIDDMPVVQSVEFQPGYLQNLWLVYLGQKQETSESVAAFLKNYRADAMDVAHFSELTYHFLNAPGLDQLIGVIDKHEERLSQLLGMQVLKKTRFSDLDGTAKSLGAWGGDFALVATPWERERVGEYLRGKGIVDWFAYNDIVL